LLQVLELAPCRELCHLDSWEVVGDEELIRVITVISHIRRDNTNASFRAQARVLQRVLQWSADEWTTAARLAREHSAGRPDDAAVTLARIADLVITNRTDD
jgi:hypothetical protein